MVFGRFDVASSTNNTAGLNIYSAFQSRRHGARAAIQQHLTNSPQGQKTRSFFAQPVSSASYCRRHHRKDCQRTCCTLAKMQQQQYSKALEQKKKAATAPINNSNISNSNARKTDQQRVAGLVDAIPAFLKCSAMSFRDIAQCLAEKHGAKDESEGRVLEGWYRLLLEMMTQAVIEAYLCDGTTGVDILLDVFSYGDLAEDEEEEPTKDATAEDNSNNTNANDGAFAGRRASIQTQQQGQTNNSQEATPTQDRQDDILFVKTAEYEAFKKAKNDRLQEVSRSASLCKRFQARFQRGGFFTVSNMFAYYSSFIL